MHTRTKMHDFDSISCTHTQIHKTQHCTFLHSAQTHTQNTTMSYMHKCPCLYTYIHNTMWHNSVYALKRIIESF